jgi:hypothetical protein
MWPRWSGGGRRIFVLGVALAAGATVDSAWWAAALATFVALAVAARGGLECAGAAAAARRAGGESVDVGATIPRPAPSG